MLRLSHFSAGIGAVTVGYSSAIILVIDLAKQAGAHPDMVTSWLLALGLGMGLTGILYSWLTRMPVVVAWSTPGAAFLLGSIGQYSLSESIGAFIVCALLSLITAQSRSLLNVIRKIPSSISSALLAGILLPICLQLFNHTQTHTVLVGVYLGVYFLGRRFFSQYLMLSLLGLSIAISALYYNVTIPPIELPTPIWVTPTFSFGATIGLGIPLFLITTLSQNLPGIAIHHAHGYYPDHKPILSGLAITQGVLAPFGGFTFNLAAITAAFCMGEDADKNKSERYKAAIAAGLTYLMMGGLASVVAAIFISMPLEIVHLLAGLALLPTLENALFQALNHAHHRHASLLTLLCTASGFTLGALTSPVWGLAVGLAFIQLQKKDKKIPAQ